MPDTNTKCHKHQIYHCETCVPVEGPVAKARRLEEDNARLRGLILAAEQQGCHCGPAAEPSGCPWCASENHYEGIHHAGDCVAFASSKVVR